MLDATEPTYVYVRGQGWVATYTAFRECETYDGHKVRLVDRMPLKGEWYMAKRYYYGYDIDGKADLDAFALLMADRNLSDNNINHDPCDRDTDTYIFVTVEVL
jgi:proline dehydrogenase